MKMIEDKDGQTEYSAWDNKSERIVTFRETAGYQRITFRSRDDKFSDVYRLRGSGYRIF